MKSATFETNRGTIVAELYDKEAPTTVENFETLANKGYYDGVKFHRVIPGFVIQGGDPYSRDLPSGDRRIGTGGDTAWECPNLPAGVKLESEVIPGNSAEHIMILSAAADAPLATGLLKMRPKPADPKAGNVPGRWMNNIEFVQGEPNSTPYVISRQTVFPVAVVEPLPTLLQNGVRYKDDPIIYYVPMASAR